MCLRKVRERYLTKAILSFDLSAPSHRNDLSLVNTAFGDCSHFEQNGKSLQGCSHHQHQLYNKSRLYAAAADGRSGGVFIRKRSSAPKPDF